MKRLKLVLQACLALLVVACGGDLAVDGTPGGTTFTFRFVPGIAVEHRLPRRISGAIPPYEFRLEGCPEWVTLFPDQVVLAGTAPPEAQDRTFFCTFHVAETSGAFTNLQTVSYGLRLVVGSPAAGPLVLPSPAPLRLNVGTFHDVALPVAVGGVAPYAYSLRCGAGALPPGMAFAPATRVFSGTPAAVFRDSCVYAVTDSARPAVTVSAPLDIEVQGRLDRLVLPVPSALRLNVGTFHDVTLPVAAGGVAPYAYSLRCGAGALPSGMAFAPATRVFSGTPAAVFRDSCVYAVTDSARPAVTVSAPLDIEVQGRLDPLVLPVPQVLRMHVGVFYDQALPPAGGGTPPYGYELGCAGGSLPPGMAFARSTRIFAGTPRGSFRDSCVYAVTDSASPPATVSQAVEVVALSESGMPLALPDTVVVSGVANAIDLVVSRRARVVFGPATGGVEPYTYTLEGCTLPAGLRFSPRARTLTGTPLAAYQGADCTYSVIDSDLPPAQPVSRDVALTVVPFEDGTRRFVVRSLEPSPHGVDPSNTDWQRLVILPAVAEIAPGAPPGMVTYRLADLDSAFFFNSDPDKRVLSYRYPGLAPLFYHATTFRYQALFVVDPVGMDDQADPVVHDTLCLDVAFVETEGVLSGVSLAIRDDAYYDGLGYRCPNAPPGPPSPSSVSFSNPVHQALGPIHGRRVAEVAHRLVRERVRGWLPGADATRLVVVPSVSVVSLNGVSDGFDYGGSSESLSAGFELGAGPWQAGFVASFTRTELHYRAAAALSAYGYEAGEHDTSIAAVHPYAAWHGASGARAWASFGGGSGVLRHRDVLGFPESSRSDVMLAAYSAGAAVPLGDWLLGALEAEVGLDAFRLDIAGGGSISGGLPVLVGRDYRAGLAWSAPIAGASSVSVAYTRLTGDGAGGSRLEAQASVAADGVLHPRLALVARADASLGVAGYRHDAWGVGFGVRIAPAGVRRGFDLVLDTRVEGVAAGPQDTAHIGVRGEVGYGLRGVPVLESVRPYVRVARSASDDGVRRALGVEVRESSRSRLRLEASERSFAGDGAITLAFRYWF